MIFKQGDCIYKKISDIPEFFYEEVVSCDDKYISLKTVNGVVFIEPNTDDWKVVTDNVTQMIARQCVLDKCCCKFVWQYVATLDTEDVVTLTNILEKGQSRYKEFLNERKMD